MIAIIGAIGFSSILFIIFRLFPKFQIDNLQAVVFNYFSAFICGILFSGSSLSQLYGIFENMTLFIVICGFLLISIFVMMAKSTQKNGMALTTVAVKMSMAVSLLLLIGYYNESIALTKAMGIILALGSVVFLSLEKDNNALLGSKGLLMLIFIGSGILDFYLNYVQYRFSSNFNSSVFSAFSFGAAALIGIVYLLIRREKLKIKNIVAGILLGIPNYFSIYFLLNAYRSTSFSDSVVLALMNLGVVMVAVFIGVLVFKEHFNTQKRMGILLAIVSILLFLISNE